MCMCVCVCACMCLFHARLTFLFKLLRFEGFHTTIELCPRIETCLMMYRLVQLVCCTSMTHCTRSRDTLEKLANFSITEEVTNLLQCNVCVAINHAVQYNNLRKELSFLFLEKKMLLECRSKCKAFVGIHRGERLEASRNSIDRCPVAIFANLVDKR